VFSFHQVVGRTNVTTTEKGRNLLMSVLILLNVLNEHQIARSSSNLRVTRILANLDRVISRMRSWGRLSTCAGTRFTVGRQSRRGGDGGQVWKVLTTASGPKTAVHYSPDGLIDIGAPNIPPPNLRKHERCVSDISG